MNRRWAWIAGLLILVVQGASASDPTFDRADEPAGWFLKILDSLGEPDLSKRRDVDAYRVVVFGGTTRPQSIRVEDDSGGMIFIINERGPNGRRQLPMRYRPDLGIQEIMFLSLGDGGFWDWPTADPNPPAVSDGFTVVMEGVRDGRYHAVIRVNPDRVSGFDTAFRMLFTMSGLPMPGDAFASPAPRHADWHERILLSMEEPDLSAAVGADQSAYRLTVLTPSDSPLAIRIQRDGDSYRIVTRRSSGTGWRADRARLVALANEVGQGTEEAARIYRRTGVLLDTRTVPVSSEDWRQLRDLFAAADFWSRTQPGQRVSRGDVMWVFEGSDGGRHQILERPGTNADPSYAAIVDLLMALAAEAP